MGKKLGVLFITLVIMLGLGGCNKVEQPPSVPSSKSPLSAYQSVLQNKAEFFSTDANKNLNIEQLNQAVSEDSSVTVKATKFALVDLDNDGTPEVILCLAVNNNDAYGFEILRYQDEVVYGYTVWYRAFMDLKADGTFSFSSGSADHGFGTMKFVGKTYSIDKISYSESGYEPSNNQVVSYFVDHESATEDEFLSAFNKQGEKAEATWYDFTDDNIEATMGAAIAAKERYDLAILAYDEFLQGHTEAKDLKRDISENGTVNISDLSLGSNTLHALFDMTGDGIPELHLRPTTGGSYGIFTYLDDQVVLWHADVDYCSPLNNGALLYERPGGAPPHTNYMYITLDSNGDELARVGFSQYDVVDENDLKVGVRYIYEDNDVSKKTWDTLTEKLLSMKLDSIEWLAQ